VQEAWLRLQRADAEEIENLEAWLATVVARICLELSPRQAPALATTPLDAFVPEPINFLRGGRRPQARSPCSPTRFGIALQVVLDALGPAERVRVCAARHVRRPVQRHRRSARAFAAGDPAARQSRPAPGPHAGAVHRNLIWLVSGPSLTPIWPAARDGDLRGAGSRCSTPTSVARSHGRSGVLELRGVEKVARAAMMGNQVRLVGSARR